MSATPKRLIQKRCSTITIIRPMREKRQASPWGLFGWVLRGLSVGLRITKGSDHSCTLSSLITALALTASPLASLGTPPPATTSLLPLARYPPPRCCTPPLRSTRSPYSPPTRCSPTFSVQT